MDGGYLTAVRTGAASGVATKYLARKDSSLVVGIFGAGVQAKMQLRAVAVARKLSKALVFDISEKATYDFITEMSHKLKLQIIKADSPDQLLETDIICTATSAATPIFDGRNVKPGTHINGIGSHTPNARELDAEIIKRAKLVADSREACLKEAGDIMIPIADGVITKDHIYAELGEIVTGRKSGRINDKEITLFKSNGLAIQDAATAKLVYERALKAGIGKEVTI